MKKETHIALKEPVELTETPFYPQKKYHCGPASLAMLLGASNVPVHPDDLASKIYLPGREGTLQLELVAAARKYGRIPYVIDDNLPALIAEIEAGRPVLVLQNLGIELIPVYHYAVVVGILPDDKIVIRSGTRKRLLMAANDFLETWHRSGAWGLILLKPDEMPENPDPVKYLNAVNSFEIVGNAQAATVAYQTAVSVWPKNQTALFALGNNFLLQQKFDQAENIFRKLLTINPNHIGALNNLAETLSQRGCYLHALRVINRTMILAVSNNSPFKETVRQTQKEITQRTKQARHNNSTTCIDKE